MTKKKTRKPVKAKPKSRAHQADDTSRQSTVYLHIGFAKTGTTALQRFYFNNAEAIAGTGVYYLDNHRSPELGYNDWGHHIHSHKWGGWLDSKVFPITPDKAWEQAAASIHSQPGTHIISSERFQDLLILPNALEILQFIKNTVAPAKLKILAYVRRQDEFAESHYKELVKNGFNRTDLNGYLENLPAFFDFNAFFAKCEEVVDRADIKVRVFDRNYFVGGNIFEDFADAIECPLPEGIDLKDSMTNPSLSSAFASLVGEPKLRAFWKERFFKHAMFNFFDRRPDLIGKDNPMISPEMKNRILDRYQASNDAMVKNYLNADSAHAFDRRSITGVTSFNENALIYSTADVRRILEIAASHHERTQNQS